MSILDYFKTLTGRKILIYSDFIDPFCYIGFHTLRPLVEAGGIELDWRGFELNPATPLEGLTLDTAANSDLRPGMWASVQGFARKAGLDFPEPRQVFNTRRAHILVHLAQKPAVKNPLIEAIYQAYFMRQQDISQIELLIDLAKPFEISPDRIRTAFSDDRFAAPLEDHRQQAQQRKFLGLPGFVYRGQNHFGALSREAWQAIFKGGRRGR
jgi:predicted DsbA family dithiol-disulfide isomerase